MLSFGMFSARALSTARRRRKLESASLPPSRAAITISRLSRVKIAPRLASAAPFLRLMVDHFECPDITFSFKKTTFVGNYAICPKIIPFDIILQKSLLPSLWVLHVQQSLEAIHKLGSGGQALWISTLRQTPALLAEHQPVTHINEHPLHLCMILLLLPRDVP